MTTKTFRSPAAMISWQLREIIAELQELQRHSSDPTCPCTQHDSGENCLMKHALGLRTLSVETAIMYPEKRQLLTVLADEALDQHNALKDLIVCGKEHKGMADTEVWARDWRKKIEPLYYDVCGIGKKAKLHDVLARLFERGKKISEEMTIERLGSTIVGAMSWETPRIVFRSASGRTYRWVSMLIDSWRTGAWPKYDARHGHKFDLREGHRVHVTALLRPDGETLYRVTLGPSASASTIARLSQPATLTKEVNALKSIATELTTACPENDRLVRAISRDLSKRAERLATIQLPAPPPTPQLPAGVVSNKTFATGITGITRYDFEYKIVEAGKLIASHDPFTFVPNPRYPQELQPRLRERAATRLQVQNIAQNLSPEALLREYHSIDRGAPIIGKDSVTESGNGRIMAVILAAKEFPAKYAVYRRELREIAPAYALDPKDVDKLQMPILVRVRLTDVPRKQFVEEANASTSIERSAVETARTDAEKITSAMLSSLEVLEGEAIEDALRSPRNKQFVTAFLNRLPSTEQARLVDAKGVLNQDGVRRTAMAVFVSTFRGDVGLRLAANFFESTDPSVRNAFNGIARSLGVLAQAESYAAEGKRQPEYAFGEDLAKAVSVYAAVKKTPGMTVGKYVSQLSLAARELTPFQERVLTVLDQHSRSAKRIGTILSNYAQAVIDSPAPAQAAFMPEARVTKEQLFEQAVKSATAVMEEIVARMFAPRKVTIPKEQLPFEWVTVPVPPPTPPTCPPECPPQGPPFTTKYQLFPFQAEGYAWLKGRSYALLADEMGLGKTPQAIHWGADFRPVLVVVPSALVLNWQREIREMWRPQDTVLVLDGKVELPSKLPDWTVMSYGMLNHYLKPLTRRNFNALITDEAHLIKNMDTKRTKNVLELVIPSEPEEGREPHRIIPNRLAVTGTPVLNRPIELFALLLFLGVKKRYDYRDFLETYTEHKYVKGRLVFTGARNLYQLHQELRPFMLRRLKKDVLKQLPPKINTPMFVPISNAAEYRDAEVNFLTWLRETAGDEAALRAASAEIIVKMNSLRRLAAIGKVAPTCDWLKPCRDGQGKVLLFCSFTEPLEKLRRCKPESVLYTGALSSAERQSIVDEFQKATGVCYFMGTIGAAGVGITLTAANRVAFLDLPWTPGGKIQAEDRAHRIGQTRVVEVVNILAKGTIDERMLQLLADKELIIAQAVDGKTKDEAASTSVANSLIEQFLAAPTMGEPIQYEPEMADPELVEVDAEQLEIAQGMRDSGGVVPWKVEVSKDEVAVYSETGRVGRFGWVKINKDGGQWKARQYDDNGKFITYLAQTDTKSKAIKAAKEWAQKQIDRTFPVPAVAAPAPATTLCNFGDWCITPEGQIGQMHGSGGLGSSRVKVKAADGTFIGYYNREELKPVEMAKPYAKEPWQMTQIEYVRKTYPSAFGKGAFPGLETEHGFIVDRAIKEGKLVSPEVLKDYPDLVLSRSEIGRRAQEQYKGWRVPEAPIKTVMAPIWPSRCQVIKQHDDGDQTLRCPDGEYVKTTDGRMFKEVQARLFDKRKKGKLLRPEQISDFDPSYEEYVRKDGKCYIIDHHHVYADQEVQCDYMTPESTANFAKLTPEQQKKMIDVVRFTPYLTREGRAERLKAMGWTPFQVIETSGRPSQARLFESLVARMFDYSWLAQKIDPCNLSVRDVDNALNFKPLRNIVAVAVGVKAKVALCGTGMVYGMYQLTIDGLTINAESKILDLVIKAKGIKQVYTSVPGQKVFEVVVPKPAEKTELTWTPQEVIRLVRREPAEQAAMFEKWIVKSVNPQPYGAVEIEFRLSSRRESDIPLVKAIAKNRRGDTYAASSADISDVTGKLFFQNETDYIGVERLKAWLSGAITTDQAAEWTLGQIRQYLQRETQAAMFGGAKMTEFAESTLPKAVDVWKNRIIRHYRDSKAMQAIRSIKTGKTLVTIGCPKEAKCEGKRWSESVLVSTNVPRTSHYEAELESDLQLYPVLRSRVKRHAAEGITAREDEGEIEETKKAMEEAVSHD